MSSAPQKGRTQARSPKPKQPPAQPHAAVLRTASASKPIPWYFWASLALVIVVGVFVLGALLSNTPQAATTASLVKTTATETGNQSVATPETTPRPTVVAFPDARKQLKNGYGEGDPAASVKVVEFGDFQCPSCDAFYNEAYATIKSQYIDTGKIYYYYKPFPLVNIHPKALKAAELATCAGDYGVEKFFAVHNLLYANQNVWVNGDEDTIWKGYLQQLKLDADKIMACVSADTHINIMSDNIDEAIALKIPGTPEFYVNDQKLDGATLQTLKQAIDAQLAKAGK